MQMKTRMLIIPAAIATLAACGGGNDNSNSGSSGSQLTPLQQAEAAASASIMGLVQFVESLVATPTAVAETQQPVNVDAVMPQTSETAAPTPVQ